MFRGGWEIHKGWFCHCQKSFDPIEAMETKTSQEKKKKKGHKTSAKELQKCDDIKTKVRTIHLPTKPTLALCMPVL